MMITRASLPLALGLGFLAVQAHAAVEQVTVRIDGLGCPFCVHNIEKRVKTLEGVPSGARVDVSLEFGRATFAWRSTAAFDPESVRQAIREAGFTPRQIWLTGSGTVELPDAVEPKVLGLVDEETGHGLTLKPAERGDRRESWEALRAFAADGQPGGVRVEGEVKIATPEPGGTWKLALHRWEPLVFGVQVIMEVDDLACDQGTTRVMQAFANLDGVIHVEADHEKDRVWIWARAESPDTNSFREVIESLGFKIGHVHIRTGKPQE